MSLDSRPPSEIVATISTKAWNVRDAARKLSERIVAFTEYLSQMPGRVEACAYGDHPDDAVPQSSRSLVLSFHREGKSWQLSYGTFHEGHNDDPENPVTYSPLSEAPLKFKIAAVEMFPELLRAVEREQDVLVQRIEAASAGYDSFMASLKTVAKGGK